MLPLGSGDDGFIKHAIELQKGVIESHTDMVVISGTLVLYLAGRFESFVRDSFEELCDKVANRCQKFQLLPKEMKENLVRMTAEVMANPRRYGHGDMGVKSFVITLASNLEDIPCCGGSGAINSKCLSITNENMRAEIVEELFARIGAKQLWKQVSQQAAIKTYFESLLEDFVAKQVKSKLDELMVIRNQVAHPSGNVQFPDISQVTDYVDFIQLIGEAIVAVCGTFEVTLKPTETVPRTPPC